MTNTNVNNACRMWKKKESKLELAATDVYKRQLYKRKIIMKEKPFIHCFRTYNCCYFYDFNTNAIVRIPDVYKRQE